MIRKIIHIDEEKCNGCGLCATACHEGAIDIINGKAKLVRENFCDGFGDCLPGCPTGAITFEEREAPAYDEAAVQENKKKKELQEKMKHLHEGGCPGSRMRMLEQPEAAESAAAASVQPVSRLRNWPVQIKLVPVNAPCFDGANLLIAAVCTGIGHNTRFGCRGLGGYSALIIVVGNSYSKAVRHTFIGNVDRCCIRVFFYQGKGCCGEIYCLCSSITESKG